MVYRSPKAPFLLTEDDESEEGPPTKAKDSDEKKPLKGIEIHMSKTAGASRKPLTTTTESDRFAELSSELVDYVVAN